MDERNYIEKMNASGRKDGKSITIGYRNFVAGPAQQILTSYFK